MERTFGMIKPNATKRKLIGRILSRIEDDGFQLVEARLTHLSKKEAEDFYAEHKERGFYNSLVEFMTSGPVLLMVLEAPEAVEKYRKLMGATDPAKAAPQTLRKVFGDSLEANSVHGSDSTKSAEREIAFFF